MRIGVIADTHVPRHQDNLPGNLQKAFAGIDIILHAGDVCDLETLRYLQNNFAITMAVHGECDDEDVRRYLQPKQVVEFADVRIGLLHGDQARVDGWRRLLSLGSSRDEEAVQAWVLEEFEGVHCIVYGHTHRPYGQVHDGVLLFNPGPAAPIDDQRPSVGILEIGERDIVGRVVYLDDL